MRWSWHLGRVAGINVFLHPTFLILLVVFFVQGGPLMAALGVAAFGCVLLHEFGHALMARRFGIGTHDITLYPIGGVARLERMPRSPGAELAIALAGPAVNLAIAGGLGAVLALSGFSGGALPFEAGVILAELLWVNVVLAAFNLLPAFPMDGGRVARALLSGWLGRVRATEVAATIGQALALVFGIYSLFVSVNLFHVALAAFIFAAAGWERNQSRADEWQRRQAQGHDGIWTAPPGYRWISRGNGVWQLAPIVITTDSGHRSWR